MAKKRPEQTAVTFADDPDLAARVCSFLTLRESVPVISLCRLWSSVALSSLPSRCRHLWRAVSVSGHSKHFTDNALRALLARTSPAEVHGVGCLVSLSCEGTHITDSWRQGFSAPRLRTTGLRVLNLSRCSFVNDLCVLSFAELSPFLEELRADYCR